MEIVMEVVCDKSEEAMDLFTLRGLSLRVGAQHFWQAVAVWESLLKLIEHPVHEVT